jgi:hypothetical protein
MMTMNKLVVLHQIVATDVVCRHSCTSVHSYRLRLCNNSINQVILVLPQLKPALLRNVL